MGRWSGGLRLRFMSSILGLILAFGVLAIAPDVVRADPRDFTFENNSDDTLLFIYPVA